MEIKEFLDKKEELEIDILKAVSGIVSKFKKETGYTPYAISVDIGEVTVYEDVCKKFAPKNVTCNFDII